MTAFSLFGYIAGGAFLLVGIISALVVMSKANQLESEVDSRHER